MRGRIEEQHPIDFIFVLLLFLVFSMCTLAVVYIGSHIYTTTTHTMEMNYNNNTAMEYIIEKVKQNNIENNIEVKQIDNTDILCIHNQVNNQSYTTYIYNDQDFYKKNGTVLMKVNDISFSINNSLLSIRITINDQSQTSYISILGGADNET